MLIAYEHDLTWVTVHKYRCREIGQAVVNKN